MSKKYIVPPIRLTCPNCKRRVPKYQLYNKGKAIPLCGVCRQKQKIAKKVAERVPVDDAKQFRKDEAARMMRLNVDRAAIALDPNDPPSPATLEDYRAALKTWVKDGGAPPSNPMLD